MKSVIVGPQPASDPVIVVAPSLLEKLGDNAMEKIALTYLDSDDEEEVIPVAAEQTDVEVEAEMDEEQEIKKGGMVTFGEEYEDSDLEMLDGPPDVFKTPSKKKAVKLKEKLDDEFLRRSRRLSEKFKGFKNAESAAKYQEGDSSTKTGGYIKTTIKRAKASRKKKYTTGAEEVAPLAMFPPHGSMVTPHLTKDVLIGIGEGFLQIQPSAVSAALLRMDDIDE